VQDTSSVEDLISKAYGRTSDQLEAVKELLKDPGELAQLIEKASKPPYQM